MKDEKSGRGSNAQNEKRDSQGRFESSNSGSRGSSSSKSESNGGGRGSNAQNEKRDSQGRFESSSSSRGRKSEK